MSPPTRLLVLLLCGLAPRLIAAPMDFAHEVVPVLQKYCADCHFGDSRKGGFSMNSKASLLDGSENGEVIDQENLHDSYFLEVLRTDDVEIQMPPKGDRPTAEEIALLDRWVGEGLPWTPGLTFGGEAWEPPLEPRIVELPAAKDGRTHPVDRLLDDYLASRDLPRPEPVSDEVFLRRAWMDVLGIPPTPEVLAAFLADTKPDKRERMIQTVLNEDIAWADHWLTFWNDLLRNDYTGTGFITGGRKQITPWLYDSLLENKPYDEFVRQLIAPDEGSAGFINGIKWRGDVNSSQTTEVQFSQNISQVFLGLNMKCASCHDSFVDRWKLDEAYGLAAIIATEPMEIHRCDKPTGEMAKAAWIFPELGDIDPEAPRDQRLEQLSKLMTHPENGRFTRTLVNRVWHRLMGRGIVHPVDAMDTMPWNEPLLDYLSVWFAENDHDMKKLVAFILESEHWQSHSVVMEEEPGEDYVYTGPIARRMTAEQFVDAIWQITGTAPGRGDASVSRSPKLEGVAPVEVEGQWIWARADTAQAAAGEEITLRRTFSLPEKPSRADIVITCDNAYRLIVNGRQLGGDTNLLTAEIWPAEANLRAGRNTIEVVGRNAGKGPNAAGLFLQSRMELPDGEVVTVSSDGQWEWTARVPDAKGKWTQKPDASEWQTARLLTNQGFLGGRADAAIQNGLLQASNGGSIPIRASLVKNDFFMRSLGRPNRDQVVTTRPEQLTTLQAIDLSNGEILANLLKNGAGNLVQNHGDDVGELIDHAFTYALSRRPTSAEATVLKEIVGDSSNPSGVEDLLWTIFMLPEFQLVR